MIQIPTNSRGAYDRGSLQTANTLRPSASYSADNLLSVNARKRTSDSTASGRHGAARQKNTGAPATPLPAWQNTGAPAISPPARGALPIPVLQKPVRKGQKVSITDSSPLSCVHACFGWNVSDPRCDVDVSAFLLDATGKVIGDSWFVFYGQTESPDKSTRFMEHAAHDREAISVDFSKLNPAVRKIVFVMTIHEALTMRLHFGMLKDAYIRIIDPADNREQVSFRLTDYYTNVISMMIGEIYLHNGIWKFNAIGNGIEKDLAGLCGFYGVEVC